MANKSFLYEKQCENIDDYYCKCKVCRSALDHAQNLADNEVTIGIYNKKQDIKWKTILQNCETSSGKLSDELISEML